MVSSAPEVRRSLEAALVDKRRVDEVVGQFAYSGCLVVGGREYSGQGAVKRGLCRLLYDHEGFARGTAEVDGDDALHLTVVGGSEVAFRLKLKRDDDDFLESVVAEPANEAAMRWLEAPLLLQGEEEEEEQQQREALSAGDAAGGDDDVDIVPEEKKRRKRPKWETDDGRVRQKIWQRENAFAEGDRFLLEKMEITEDRVIAVIDATVWRLYEKKLSAWASSVGVKLEAVVAPGNEDEKTMDNLLFLLDELARVDPLRRSEPVLAIGGGVLTDTAGFACALWRRGIPWCRLPTTLLGMVDASVGIKVAVNYHRKNGVGHFFSPMHTFIDSSFLKTLTSADVKSGCGEIMKAALIHDADLFDLMERSGLDLIKSNFAPEAHPAANVVVQKSVDAMLECIGPDLWEEALLRPMDFGHSFSRTLEASEDFQLRHGEAVAIDCVMSTMIANVLGLVSNEDADRVLNLYAKLDLPCSIAGVTADTYKRATKEITVHRDGILRAPLPRGIGACAFVDSFTDDTIDQAFAKLQTFMTANPHTEWDASRSFNSNGPAAEEVLVTAGAEEEVLVTAGTSDLQQVKQHDQHNKNLDRLVLGLGATTTTTTTTTQTVH